jgi:hypothetical protein
VFTEPLLRNGLHDPVVLLLRADMLLALPSNGRCLQSHCLATGLYTMLLRHREPEAHADVMDDNVARRHVTG